MGGRGGGFEPVPDDVGLDGDVLRGVGASRGRHTGRARVFDMQGDLPDVERGDILVARNAGQDWTPILSLLGGIVLDEGAAYQHAALVAREYRVPCVIQTREGTTAITDGQRITIDGTAGLVELSPAPSSVLLPMSRRDRCPGTEDAPAARLPTLPPLSLVGAVAPTPPG